ncbi:hypothetical protein AV530_009849 [Patagioenas fasciata monilis]|uniref:Uncharacterized protein n=1 Tax=Patagioenas fasciata monilis TaxID=372326 RepID=A0A1V4KA93_PATFA|nr:hypothetical protein AV530_009849 [Patagioenas fasciata monilis]
MAGGASQAVARWPAHITGVSSTAQLLGLSWIFEEESKALLQCFCARGECATEPECLGQPRSEEAAAVHGQGSRCPQAGGRGQNCGLRFSKEMRFMKNYLSSWKTCSILPLQILVFYTIMFSGQSLQYLF